MLIGKKMGFGFGVLLALVVTLTIVVLYNLSSMNRQFSYVIQHDAPVIANARHLSKLVVDMETGQRGFVITGEDEFLEPYNNAVASFTELLNEEKRLVSDNPPQVKLLEKIAATVQLWQEKAAQPEIAMRRKVGEATVDAFLLQEILSQGMGKRLMDEFMAFGHQIEVSFSDRGDWEGAYTVELIEKCMADREDGQRGFLITGKEEFLDKYYAGEQNKLPEYFARLRKIISDRGRTEELSDRVDRLEELTREWSQVAAEPEIAARRKMNEHPESLRDVAALLELGTGKKLLDRIRVDFADFIKEEERLTAKRFASASRASRTTTNTTLLLTLISVIFGGLMAIKITLGITKPVRNLARAVNRVAQGDLSQPFESKAKDEIGELSRSFNQMVGNLKRLEVEREHEVEERKRGEAELHRAQTRNHSLLEGSPVCNKIIDLDSRLLYMSKAGQKLLKIDDITPYYGCTYPPEFYPDAMRAPLIEHLDRALAGEITSVECPVTDIEGNELWFQTTFVPARDEDGQIEYIIATSVHITDRKRMEVDLIKAKEKAESATQAKSAFLVNMSHEIRTPMTAILGFAENLIDKNLCENDKLEYAQTIRRNGVALLDIINDILDLSKIEAGKMGVEQITCNPYQLIADVTSLMKIRADEKKLLLNIEYDGLIPETFLSDPTRLRQILINIISNAIKFTTDGSVTLVVRCVETSKNHPAGQSKESYMQFDVVDTGIGISDEQAKTLFQPFTQADASTTRKFGGTGLGLTISRRFADLLGGEITLVESEVGVGTRFRVTVTTGPLVGVKMLDNPLSETVLTDSANTVFEVAPSMLAGLHILLAEDCPDNQKLLRIVLQKAGAIVTVEENGKLTLEKALAATTRRRSGDPKQPFDVIIMDMQMPVMDGYEATRELRQRGYTGVIIALTANAMVGDREKCIEAGCDGYATKPIDRKKLIETIQHLSMPAEAVSPAAI